MKFKISGIFNPQQRRWSVIHWVNSPVNLTVFLFQEEIKIMGNFSWKISQFLIVQIDQPWLWSNSSKGHSLLILWQTTKFTNTDVLVSFTIFVSESNCKMNKEKFIILFKKNENTSEDNEMLNRVLRQTKQKITQST